MADPVCPHPTLATVSLPRLGPPRTRLPSLALDSPPLMRVLGVGARTEPWLGQFVRAGSGVVLAPSVERALRELSDGEFQAVLAAPHVHAHGDGLRLVRAMKHARLDAQMPQTLLDFLSGLVERCARVPFGIAPLQGDREWAVFDTAEVWYLLDLVQAPIVPTLTRLAGGARAA